MITIINIQLYSLMYRMSKLCWQCTGESSVILWQLLRSRSLIHTIDYNSDYVYCFVSTSINNVSCQIRQLKEYTIKDGGSVVLT